MRSYIFFIIGASLAIAVRGAASHAGDDPMHPRDVTCMPSDAGGCASCGANYVQCGPDTCYNPSAGEVCCSSKYSCPASANCSSTGTGCVPKHGPYPDADCDDDDDNDNNYSTSTTTASISSAIAVAIPSSSSVSTTSDLTSTTSYTTTITSTTTSTVTVSMTSSSAGACSATTGLPMTTSMALFGNSTTVALNTTTSTLSVTNVSTTTAASLSANATVPTKSIVPPISGYTGAATDLQGQSSTSLFALGSLVFMAALLV
ncbi:uncharacterized protein Z519_07511 [Cladophialophora bantiana CBS 173.52]|uniref:GPI anchored protein n=1 Tax=Cladophialophora bantiana (strain ATCC 10958 / CBS 173.52 / CDC B-1940 / NIH 8579) TaxID=1442370 RepID=A0A0D2HLC9_CLAB1|nr:uncharacterized protein Z519_07511 [Cladophialophora bantiana CBS 173.52]KIW91545.1 hypothetical protein Z519_07511 [Cladophialophora bantiana CBS 173.52]